MDYLGGLNIHGETGWKLMMRGTKAAATRKTGHNKRGRVMNAGARVYKRILKLDPRLLKLAFIDFGRNSLPNFRPQFHNVDEQLPHGH